MQPPLIECSPHRTTARDHLEALLLDLHGAPSFFVRQNRSWKSKARRLLAKLPPA
jgi:hypothetical protein